MRIEVAELSLAALDAAQADALALFVGPERPLQGLAGLADWRLCGAVSRALRGGAYAGEGGEQLLLPTQDRLRIPRAFCFGVTGPPADEAAFRALAYRTLDALLKAGSRAHAIALPPRGPGLAAADTARLWLEATLRFPPARQLLLGDGPALRRDLAAARDALRCQVEIASADAGPSERAATLPGPSAVVR